MAFLLGASPAYAYTTKEISAELARSKASLTAARDQLTPEQWALLSGKLASAEKALAEYNELVAATGQAAAAEAGAAAGGEVVAAEGEAAAGAAASVLARMGSIFIALATIKSDDDQSIYASRERRRLEEQLEEVGRAAERVKAGIEEAKRAPVPKPVNSDDKDEDDGDVHHIATDKNDVSDAQGGPWTPIFTDLFAKAGMTLNDPANKVKVKGHRGPHPKPYHEEVQRRLALATAQCRSVDQCRDSLTRALQRLALECATPGTRLNLLITTPATR